MSTQPRRDSSHLISPAFLLLAVLAGSSPARADRIILRSLKILSDRSVLSFDDEGVLLDNQTRLPWHDIEKGTIARDKQAAFDQRLAELGGPLYRIRQRLATADYQGLLQPAEQLYQRFATSKSDTAYLVIQSVMWGRIAAGRREESLEPYLSCYELLHARPAAASVLAGERRLTFDRTTGLTPELTPVWFNEAAAKQALPGVYRRIAEMAKPRPEGAYIYFGTLALAAGDEAAATKVLGAVQAEQPPLSELRAILEAQREVRQGKPGIAIAQLETMASQMIPANRSLAWYWLGLSKLPESDREKRHAGLLQLLRIPALSGRDQPELAGAALYQVMQSLTLSGDAASGVSVRRELLERYGQTYYALQVRGATESEKRP